MSLQLEEVTFSFKCEPEFNVIHLFTQNITEVVRDFDKRIDLAPAEFRKDSQRIKKIKSFEPVLELIPTCEHFDISSAQEEYNIQGGIWDDYASLYFTIQPSLLETKMSGQVCLDFFKQSLTTLQECSFATVSEEKTRYVVSKRLKSSVHYNARYSMFQGFKWLNYFNQQEMELNGGKELLTLPHFTHAESFGSGALIQVGASYTDGLTESGQDQLYQATQDWAELVKSKDMFDENWWDKSKELDDRLEEIINSKKQ